MSELFKDAWAIYNTEDSWWPFVSPLMFWVTTCIYCYLPSPANSKSRPTFDKWMALHNVHHAVAISLGLCSMYFDDDAIFNERIPILWSLTYFAVDFSDCAIRGDWVYLVHALFCLLLGIANYTTPLFRELRMNSKASLLELSNPFQYLVRQTRDPIHFAMFAAVYTCCRILWLPYMMKQLVDHDMPMTDVRFLCLAGFYGMNWWWYYKILKILFGFDKKRLAKSNDKSNGTSSKKND